MIKLSTVYTFPAQPIKLADWLLRADWFPEVEALEWSLSTEILETLDAEGRLSIRRVFHHDCGDSYRYAEMHAVWFDDKPVMLVQNAGRSGDDVKRRWITDRNGFEAICHYLRQHLGTTVNDDDVYDPDSLVYEEDILELYGVDFGTAVGYPSEPAKEGLMLLGKAHEFFEKGDSTLYFAMAKPGFGEMPQYIRRGGYVMTLVRELSAEDYQDRPNFREVCEKDGYTQLFWYQHCERPADATIVKV